MAAGPCAGISVLGCNLRGCGLSHLRRGVRSCLPMKGLFGGHRARLGSPTPAWGLLVGVEAEQGTVLDLGCFGADENDKLSDDRLFVFYNQRRSSEGCICAPGLKAGGAEVFRAALTAPPSSVRRLAFTTAAENGEGTMAALPHSHPRLLARRPRSRVAGLTVEPEALAIEEHDVRLSGRYVSIFDAIEVRPSRTTRTIEITGGVDAPGVERPATGLA